MIKNNFRKRLISCIVFTVIGLTFVSASWAANYYVAKIDARGNPASDANPGTEASPWLSITHAANKVNDGTVSSGSTIYVKKGDYSNDPAQNFPTLNYSGKDSRFNGKVLISKARSIGDDYITFEALKTNPNDVNDKVITKGFMIGPIDSIPTHKIRIKGFEIAHSQNIYDGGGTKINIYQYHASGISINGDYTEILDNYIHHCYQGIAGDQKSSFAHIKGNTLSYNNATGIAIGGSEIGSNSWLVEENDISHGSNVMPTVALTNDDTDATRFTGNNHVIRNNYAHDYLSSENNGLLNPHMDFAQTFTESLNVTIEGNIVKDIQGQITQIAGSWIRGDGQFNGPVDHLTFKNNVFIRNAGYGLQLIDTPDTTIVNNTFVDMFYSPYRFSSWNYNGVSAHTREKEDILVTSPGCHNAIVKNNIYYQSPGFLGGNGFPGISDISTFKFSNGVLFEDMVSSNNLLYPADLKYDTASWKRFDAFKAESGSIFNLDPQFVDPTHDNYHLQAGSFAKGAGTKVEIEGLDFTADKDGVLRDITQPDIGAYEYTLISDDTMPTVSIISPTDTPTVHGTVVHITANASDNLGGSGIYKVEFYVDGAYKNIDFIAPYNFDWTTENTQSGAHTIFAKAYDYANNSTQSAPITVNVDNAGLVSPGWSSIVLDKYSFVAGKPTAVNATVTLRDTVTSVYPNGTPVANKNFTVYMGIHETGSLSAVTNSQGVGTVTFEFNTNDENVRTKTGGIKLTVRTEDNIYLFDPQGFDLQHKLKPDSKSNPTIAIVPDVLTHIVITPDTAQAIAPGATIQFKAQGQDQYDNNISGLVYTWRGVNAKKIFSNPTPGTYLVEVSAPTKENPAIIIKSPTISVTVGVGGPDTTPPTVTLTAPVNGTTVSGPSVTISANASDNVAVAKVEFYDGTTLLNTDTVAPYSYSWNSTAAANGSSHVIKAKAYDSSNLTSESQVVTVTVNNVAVVLPDTSFTTKPNPITNLTTATFSFNSTKPNSTFEGKLDTAAWATVTNPITLTNLTAGSHTYYVRAKDAAGNIDPTPASYTWQIDTIAPVIVITAPANEAILTTSPITLSGTIDGVAFSETKTLTPGLNTLTRQATDQAGNIGRTSITVTYNIADTEAGTTERAFESYLMSTGADDVYATSSAMTDNATQLRIGNASNTVYRSFLRWQINIPKGAEVSSAYLQMKLATTAGTFTSRASLLVEDDDNIGPFTSGQNPWNRNVLEIAPNVALTVPLYDNAGLTVGSFYYSADIKDLVQAFVNRPNYVPGNYIGLRLEKDDAASGQYTYFSPSESTYYPVLWVSYNDSNADLHRAVSVSAITDRWATDPSFSKKTDFYNGKWWVWANYVPAWKAGQWDDSNVGSEYLDDSTDAKDSDVSDFALMTANTNGDGFLFASPEKYAKIIINIGKAASGGTPVYQYQYWNGSAWTALTTTATPSFNATGITELAFNQPGDWALTSEVSGVPNNMYAIRVRATTAPTSVAALATSFIFETYGYKTYDGTTVGDLRAAEYVPDGVGDYFAVARKDNVVYLAWTSNSGSWTNYQDVRIKRGTINADDTIAWGETYTVFDSTGAYDRYSYALSLAYDQLGNIWVATTHNGVLNARTYVIRKSTRSDDVSAWNSIATMTGNTYHLLTPLGSNKMLYLYNDASGALSGSYADISDETNWTPVGSGVIGGAGVSDNFTSAVDGSGNVYIVYRNSGMRSRKLDGTTLQLETEELIYPRNSNNIGANNAIAGSKEYLATNNVINSSNFNTLMYLKDRSVGSLWMPGRTRYLGRSSERFFDRVQLYSSSSRTTRDVSGQAAGSVDDVYHNTTSALLKDVNDYIEFAHADKFWFLYADQSRQGDSVGLVQWQYWNGSSWSNLTPYAGVSNFGSDEFVKLWNGEANIPSNWAADSDGLYKVRAVVTTPYSTTTPIGSAYMPIRRSGFPTSNIQGGGDAAHVGVAWMTGFDSNFDAVEFSSLGDVSSPVVTETTAVSSPTIDPTPNYTFTTDRAGTIVYGGDCSSQTAYAAVGANTVTFNTLLSGTHSNCTIKVSNTSNTLNVTPFTINTGGRIVPVLTEVTPVTTPTNDTTPNYTFNSTEAGTITYGGDCSSAATSTTSGNKTITFNALSAGTHSNCTIIVTDADLNPSTALNVTPFIIDIIPPTISSVQSNPSATSAIINWTTNENADSQVEYGTTTDYGASTTLDTRLITAHSQTISGLTASTAYHFRVKSKDATGNLATSVNYTFTTSAPPDTVLPDTSFTTKPNPITNLTTANFGFNSTKPNSTFEGKLDAAAWATVTNPINLTNLTAGSHIYQARAKDAVGTDATPASYAWQIDTTAPIVVITSPANGAIVTTSPITLTGTIDGVAFSESRNLTAGLNTLTREATDDAGNIGRTSVTVTYNIAVPLTNTYYVAKIDADGKPATDANPGTETQPFLTIQKAVNAVKAGDTIRVMPGTYDERPQLTTSGTGTASISLVFLGGAVVTKGIRVTGSYWIITDLYVTPGISTVPTAESWGGTVPYVAHISLRGDGIKLIRPKFSDPLRLADQTQPALMLGGSHITVTDMDFAHVPGTGCYISKTFGAHNNTISGGELHHTGVAGLNIQGDNHTVEDLVVHDTGANPLPGQMTHGCLLNGTGITLRRLRFYNMFETLDGNHVTGIMWGAPRHAANLLIDSCIFGSALTGGVHNVKDQSGIFGMMSDEVHSGGYDAYSLPSNNGIIRNSMFLGASTTWNLLTWYNTYNALDGWQIYNNIFFAPGGIYPFGYPSYTATLRNWKWKNNIFFQAGPRWTDPSWEVDYNVYVNGAAHSTVPGADAHSLNLTLAQVGFVDYNWDAAHDYGRSANFHLLSTSLLINAGIDHATDVNVPTLDKDGKPRVGATDIGPYEYQGAGGEDTTAPVISSVQSNPSLNSAIVSWTTNENADSQVEYGATTAYGASTTLNTSLVTAHSQTISGLTASTAYHFRVKSKDATGNLATSVDYTFTTSAPPDTTLPDTSFTTNPNPITNLTTAIFGFSSTKPNSTFEGKLDAAAWLAVTNPITLTNLTAGPHTYQAKAKDAVGTDPTPASYAWEIDLTPPAVVITSPANEAILTTSPITLTGTIDGVAFSESRNLTAGLNTLTREATDQAGNIGRTSVIVTYNIAAPLTNTYYVAKTGNDTTGDGSSSKPWLTISKAALAVKAGDTILVGPGDYPERVHVHTSGTAAAKITFKSQTRRTASCRGFSLGDSGTTSQANYIRIEGFEINNTPKDSWDASAVRLHGGHNEIVDNYMHHVRGSGVQGANSAYAAVDIGNIVKDNVMMYCSYGVVAGGSDWLIENNDVSHGTDMHDGDDTGDTDGFRFSGTGHIFRGNYVHDFLYSECWSAPHAPHTDFIQAFGTSSNILIENNRVMRMPSQLCMFNTVSIDQHLSDITFRNNLFVDNGKGLNIRAVTRVYVYNNTFVTSTGGTLVMIRYGTGNVPSVDARIYNNIFYNTTGNWSNAPYGIDTAEGCSATADNNLVFPVGTNPIPADMAALETNPRWGWDPVFVNPATNDYHLQVSSTAINAGVKDSYSPTLDAEGHTRSIPPDVGPYEYQGTGGGDTTPPTVALTAPVNGATVSGSSVTISANASDNVAVAKVEFYDGATLLNTDISAPYSYSWNSTAVANSSHIIKAKAYDTSNLTNESQVTVTVNNVAVVLPDTNFTTKPNPITNLTTATFGFSSTKPNSTFEGKLDAAAWATVTNPITLTNLTARPHTYYARATDAVGTDASPASYAWEIDTIAPVVVITSPANEAILTTSPITLSGTIDGVAFSESRNLTAGPNTLTREATDQAGNTGRTSVTVTYNIIVPGAKTYYVATTGSDANSGTEASPFLTIGKAANTVKAGDTVLVGPGDYNERVHVRVSGTSGALITFKAQTRRTASCRGFSLGDEGATVKANYIRIEGFEINNTPVGWDSSAVRLHGGHNEIIDNYMHHIRGSGVQGANSTYAAVDIGNIVKDNTITDMSFGVVAGGSDWLIENNDVSRGTNVWDGKALSGSDTDAFRFSGTGHIFRGNYTHDWPPHSDDQPTPHPHTDWVQCFSEASNILFENNIVIGMPSRLTFLEVDLVKNPGQSMSDITFRNNLFVRGGNYGLKIEGVTRCYIYNNTFVDFVYSPVAINADRWGNPSIDARIYNNIFYQTTGNWAKRPYGINTGCSATADGNLVYPTGANSIPPDMAALESNPRWGWDPKFLNPAVNDYHLRAGSEAIDAGVHDAYTPLTDKEGRGRYDDPATTNTGTGAISYVDIGAYEYQGTGGGDTTPPVISSIQSNPSATSAIINWTTNENADSQIEYGTTTDYGASTTLNTSLVTAHSQTISGLIASTAYHFRVKSKDATGNLATSADYTFTTSATAILPDTSFTTKPNPITNLTTATFGFSSTKPNSTFEGRLDDAAWAIVTNPITLTNLTAGSHTYQARARDAVGTDASPASYTWQIDLTPPVVVITAPLNGTIVTTSPITLSGTIDGVAFSESRNLIAGPNTLTREATDQAGNIGRTSVTVTYNIVVPSINTYYVAKTGNDNNLGTEASPWKTIGKAALAVKAGDTIRVMPGTYDERPQLTMSGALGAPIKLLAHSGAGTVTVTKGLNITGSWWEISDIAVRGFTVADAISNNENSGWGSFAPGQFNLRGTHIRLVRPVMRDPSKLADPDHPVVLFLGTDCSVEDVAFSYTQAIAYKSSRPITRNNVIGGEMEYCQGDQAVNITGDDHLIQRLTIHDSQGSIGANNDGIVLNGARITLDGVVIYNLFKWNPTINQHCDAVQFFNVADDLTIKNCRFGSWATGGVDNGRDHGHVNWSCQDPEDSCLRLRVFNNWFMTGTANHFNTSAGGNRFGGMDGWHIYNNYFGGAGFSDLGYVGKYTGLVFQNNIMTVSGRNWAAADVVCDYNAYIGGAVKGVDDGSNSIQVADAGFVDYATDAAHDYGRSANFHLLSTSPLINAGISDANIPTADADGKPRVGAPDIGPYEYQGTGGGDITPPVISNVQSNPSATSAIINWTTNENADSQIEYGTTTAYGTSTTLDTSLVTAHSQTIASLTASTIYHYRVRSKDATGNLATSDYTFTTSAPPDTVLPDTSFITKPNPITNLINATFGFSSTKPNSTFEGRLDDALWATVTNPITLTNLAAGQHTYYARAKDVVGTDPTPASYAWEIDTIAPVIIITSPKDNFLTNQPNLTVNYTVDGLTKTKAFSLTEGLNTLTIAETDTAGNSASQSLKVTLDTKAPAIVITAPKDGAIVNTKTINLTGTVDGVAFTESRTLTEGLNTLTKEATDEAGNKTTESVKVTLDTIAPVVVITTPRDGDVVNTLTITLAGTVDNAAFSEKRNLIEGLNTLTKESTDQAGNKGSDTVRVTLDTKAPTIVITAPKDGAIVNTKTINLTGTVDGVAFSESRTLIEGLNTLTKEATNQAGNKAIASVRVTLDTKDPVIIITSPKDNFLTNQPNLTVNYTVDGLTKTKAFSLTEGLNTLTIVETDLAGNSSSQSIKGTLDTIAPVVVITSPKDGAVVNTPTITLSGTVDNAAFSEKRNLTEGLNTLTKEATDQAGNKGSASVKVTLDTTAPAIIITSPKDGAVVNTPTITLSGTVDGVSFSESKNLTEGLNTLTKEASDESGNKATASVKVTLDTKAPIVVITAPKDGAVVNTPTITLSGTVDNAAFSEKRNLTEGLNTLTKEASDQAGNKASASVKVTLDTNAPIITITAPKDGAVVNTSPITLTGTVDGVAFSESKNLTEGLNTLTKEATDNVGNKATASVKVTLDTKDPIIVITSPKDNFLTNQPDLTVNYTVDGAAKTKAFSLTEGLNTLTITETDLAGNSSSQSIKGTLDTKAPIIVITAPKDGAIISTPTVNLIGTVDNVAFSESRKLTNGGVNILTKEATDQAGNKATALIKVIFTAPVVVITSPKDGAVVNTPTVTLSGTVDNVAFSETKTLNEGLNTLVKEAADKAGNKGSASVKITLDTTAPVVKITSPADGAVVNTKTITLTGTVDGVAFSETRTLSEGLNTLTKESSDEIGNKGSASVKVTLNTKITSDTKGILSAKAPVIVITPPADITGNKVSTPAKIPLDTKLTKAPVIVITSLKDNTVVNTNTITLTGTVDGVAFSESRKLKEGLNTLTKRVTDNAGNKASASVKVTLDTTAPLVRITSPADGAIVNTKTIALSGTIDGETFSESRKLKEGLNILTKESTDEAGNKGSDVVRVTLDTKAPIVVITSPLDGAKVNTPTITLTGTVDGVAFSESRTLKEGLNTVTKEATDEAGNKASASIKVTKNINRLPSAVSISPASGTILANKPVVFTAKYRDADGWKDIKRAFFLINSTLERKNCLYAYYDNSSNKLYLINDEGTRWYGGHTPGENKILANSYVSINCLNTSVSGSGADLVVSWNLTFKPAFKGAKKMYLNVIDNNFKASGLTEKGSQTIK